MSADRREHLLDVRGVSFSFGTNVVVDDVDLYVAAGEFVALVGPNGAGKTTLLRIALGSLTPQAGTVEIFGVSPDRFRRRWRLGYVPQRPTLAANLVVTVEEIVAAGRLADGRWWRRRTAADAEAIDHALEVVGLSAYRDERAARLSGGQQQRAFIARALASRPELLVLDEPIAGVDAQAQTRFREALVHHVRVHGGGILLVTHEIDPVKSVLDRLVVINRSIHFDGPPHELPPAEAERLPLVT